MSKDSNLLIKLNSALAEKNWDELSEYLKPKLFATIQTGNLVDSKLLAKVAEILTVENPQTPDNIKIICLKCLGNSCLSGYRHKELSINDNEPDIYCNKLYSAMSENDPHHLENLENVAYPPDTYFPYNGIADWTIHYIISHNGKQLLNEQLEIMRLCVQFLCNLFTFACKGVNSPDCDNIQRCLDSSDFKTAVVNLVQSEHVPLVRAVCMFMHNALKKLNQNYFSDSDKIDLCLKLLKPIKDDLACAKEILMILLCQSDILKDIYENVSPENKLYLLEIIYHELSATTYQSETEDTVTVLTKETIEFLAQKFCRKSDLILKTIDRYLNGMEPTEIVILLDILGALTSKPSEELTLLQNDKSLLINCIFLLKSLHMAGKESINYFTPVQKLSEVAPGAQGITIDRQSTSDINITKKQDSNIKTIKERKNNLQCHPAFGFKAGLIRVIGNLSYKNKAGQDLLRETDAIPLLLDCCNIDARNPLIMQWTILALRNVCEGNPGCQEIIRNSTKVGVVDNAILREMGLTLHEEESGRTIGIMPLPRDNEGK